MPHSTEDFGGVPPFPETVPTAPLLRISLAKLLAGDSEEQDRLWKACCDLGFFYLDLRADEDGRDAGLLNGSALVNGAGELFKVAEGLFDLPLEEKQKFDFREIKKAYFGYKGYGDGIVDVKGSKDRNEAYNASKDEILGIPQPPGDSLLPAPAYFNEHRPLLQDYCTRCHAVATFLLGLLNPRLELPKGKLETLHRLEAPSLDAIRFIKAPPQPVDDRKVALGAHTDFGSVTVLFNRVGGLQVRLPLYMQPIPPSGPSRDPASMPSEEDGENWAYVKPLPGHAIINLGDALVKLSGGMVRSNIHRVRPPPDTQAGAMRYSMAYFCRPANEVLMRALEESPLIKEKMRGEEPEEAVNSKDWVLRRAMGFRKGGPGWATSRGTEDATLAKDVEAHKG